MYEDNYEFDETSFGMTSEEMLSEGAVNSRKDTEKIPEILSTTQLV